MTTLLQFAVHVGQQVALRAKKDLTNVTNEVFAAKALEAGIEAEVDEAQLAGKADVDLGNVSDADFDARVDASLMIGSASDIAAVTPNDSVDLAATTRAIYVGTAGSLKITTDAGNARTIANVLAGETVDVQATRIWATGTTASNIVAEF